MIKSIYIMQENGVLLYSKNFKEEKFDSNILIGFFASIANFSREALNSVVRNMDLGDDNKLILQHIAKEKIIVAAIVSSTDNNDLINKIVKNILLDFVNELLIDEDNVENIDNFLVDEIVKENLKRKSFPSQHKLIIISFMILIPLLIGLLSISIVLTNEFGDWIINFAPALMLYSSINLLFLTAVPNLISGILSPSRKVVVMNSLIIMLLEVIAYLFLVDFLFRQIIMANLPINLILSLAFGFAGQRISARRFLK